MATSEIGFDLQDRVDPASNAPGTTTGASAAAATSNTFQTRFFTLDFDQSTDECTSWEFMVPSNYSSGGTCIIDWFATPTSGNVIWKVSAYVATASSSDIDTSAAFNAPDLSAATAVPSTSGQFKQTSIALTSPGFSANKWAIVMLGRDADAGGDTAAGDARVIAFTLQYTST